MKRINLNDLDKHTFANELPAKKKHKRMKDESKRKTNSQRNKNK